jgi:hypothetical protein
VDSLYIDLPLVLPFSIGHSSWTATAPASHRSVRPRLGHVFAELDPCNYGVLRRSGTVRLGDSDSGQYIAVTRVVKNSTRIVALIEECHIWIT